MSRAVSDEMVEAVWNHNKGSALITKQTPFAEIDTAWRNQIRDALEAALAVAPDPAPDDAEFEQLVREYGTAAWDYNDGGSTTHKELEQMLAHILTLHRQARHAGLREWLDANRDPLIRAIGNYANFKAVISERSCAGYSTKKYESDAESEWAKIDALLAGTEATDDR